MTEQEALEEGLEEVRSTVSKFYDFISDADPISPINVVDLANAAFTRSTLDYACKEFLSRVEEQMRLEREKETMISRQMRVLERERTMTQDAENKKQITVKEIAIALQVRMVEEMAGILKDASQAEVASLLEATARVLFPGGNDQIKISIEERL